MIKLTVNGVMKCFACYCVDVNVSGYNGTPCMYWKHELQVCLNSEQLIA